MMRGRGFWSYVHLDDESESGRIARLARDVRAQYQLLTGADIELFLDKDAIKWGEVWRDKIDASLTLIEFFVPVLTPRYFMSGECRRELAFFMTQATRLGVKELVLPLHYVDVPELRNDDTKDDLVRKVRDFQWEDWKQLRFEEPTSQAYRSAVARLAARLVEANRQAEALGADGSKLSARPDNTSASEPPGLLDRMALAEESLPRWKETLEAIAREITEIGQIMQGATAELEKGESRGAGFGHRLKVVRAVAQHLTDPAERVFSFGNEFVTHLHDVDSGVRAIIEQIPAALEKNPDDRHNCCKFFRSIRTIATAIHSGLDSLGQMVDAISPIENLSRDMRPALRKLRSGLTVIVEARDVGDEWVELIDSLGIKCDDLGAEADAPQ